MRFGIMDMQIGALVPSGINPNRALQHIGSFTQARLVRELAAAGFTLVELGGDLPLFFPQAFSPRDVEELAALKQERGLTFTVHLPLWSVEPSTPNVRVREGSVRSLVEAIRSTQPLDPEIYVLHATGALAAEFFRMRLPETARSIVLQQFARNAAASISQILAETGIPSRHLAIETIEFPFDLLLEIANKLDTSITFDTGHVLAGFSGPLDFFDALARVLPRLGEVHLHDAPLATAGHAPAYGQDHQALGRGALELERLLDTLEEAHFNGPIIFELTVEQTLESLARVRATRPRAVQ